LLLRYARILKDLNEEEEEIIEEVVKRRSFFGGGWCLRRVNPP
jgi:hypothetical protein